MDMDVGIKDVDSKDVINDKENEFKDKFQVDKENECKRNYKSISSIECNNNQEDESAPSSSSVVGASLFPDASTNGTVNDKEKIKTKKSKLAEMNQDLDCEEREKGIFHSLYNDSSVTARTTPTTTNDRKKEIAMTMEEVDDLKEGDTCNTRTESCIDNDIKREKIQELISSLETLQSVSVILLFVFICSLYL